MLEKDGPPSSHFSVKENLIWLLKDSSETKLTNVDFCVWRSEELTNV